MTALNDSRDLEALFSPPTGLHGSHMLLCGLSADASTLERMLVAFSNETPAQRRASGLVRGLLMLDASSPISHAQPVAGLLQLFPVCKNEWRRRTSLMHAKVALLGFATSRFAAPQLWRLVVSTGNWTGATWSSQTQIDMFWSTEWDSREPESNEAQRLADVRAGFIFFDTLMRSLYAVNLVALQDDRLVVGWLEVWRQKLFKPTLPTRVKSQFIDSLQHSLLKQIKARYPKTAASTLVVGSGFFEQGLPSSGIRDPKPSVLKELETLGAPSARYLVFNPKQAGGIASWIEALSRSKVGSRHLAKGRAGNWELCTPRDPLTKQARLGRGILHAKYIAALHSVRDSSARLVFLYLGSGNLSRLGLMSHAKVQPSLNTRPPGNVEAGILITPDARIDQVWQRLACGDIAETVALKAVEPGVGEDIFEPLDPPPVLFFRESEDQLFAVRSDVALGSLWVEIQVDQWVLLEPRANSISHRFAQCPALVRVRDREPEQLGGKEWQIAVLSAQGLLCKRDAPQIDLENALDALRAFPRVPSYVSENDDNETEPVPVHFLSNAVARYPLRTLSLMIETVAQRNALIEREEFPYWLSQLRSLLVEQAAPSERKALGALGIDLFDALLQPGFAPEWIFAEPALLTDYREFVESLRAAWTRA